VALLGDIFARNGVGPHRGPADFVELLTVMYPVGVPPDAPAVR
jgi:hypothetical protein